MNIYSKDDFSDTRIFWRDPKLTQSYWHGNAQYQADYEKWHKRLDIPFYGKANTVNGQILRSFDLMNIQLFKVNSNDLEESTSLADNKFELNMNPLFQEALNFIEEYVGEAKGICNTIRQAYEENKFVTYTNAKEYAERLNMLGDIIMKHLISHA